MIRNIIFDWSGTLVDDLPAVLQATNHVFRLAGVAEITLETFRAEFRLPFKGFYDRYVPHVPLNQLEQWFHGHFRQVQDSVAELPHTREFLEECARRNVRVFILTTVHPDHFELQAQSIGYDQFIDTAYAGVMDKTHRIKEILAENGLVPDETIFIGDMQHDVKTAHHGGVHSCAVLTGYNSLEQLRASRPELIVEHLGELLRLLERNDWEFPTAAKSVITHPVITVGALIFNRRGEVLMMRTHKWSNLWGIPGGKVKFGESMEDALRREIKEETNLEVAEIGFVMAQDCIHSKEFYRDAHFVLLNFQCVAKEPLDVVLNDEAQEFRWVTTDQALQMPLNTPTRILVEEVRRIRSH